MKTHPALVVLLTSIGLGSQALLSQSSPFGPQQVITTAADGPYSVYATDLDGDGDMDVLSASGVDDKIAWYANDGSGNFGPQQVITTAADDAQSVYAADLDGDGDMDVLSASVNDDKIAWYANDGSGNFGPQHVITTSANGATSVYAADLDGDGDMDVLSASYNDDKIAYYANDGFGNFGFPKIITIHANFVQSVYATDLDGDGDIDVLSASAFDDKIAWYANDGAGSFFGPDQIITTSADGAASVYATDLDGDGDMDVLSASSIDDKIAWYANHGSGIFGPQQVITTAADGARSVYAADFDGDGDMDVLSASSIDDKIAYYTNDGSGNFGPQQVITTAADGARSVYAADFDGDGDMDVLSASYNDDKIAWCENRHASIESYGSACHANPPGSAWYESFAPSVGGFDLSNKVHNYVWQGSGYLLRDLDPYPSAIYPPQNAPTVFGDDEVQVASLGFTMPTLQGSVTDIAISSNGWLSFDSSVTYSDWSPSVQGLLENPWSMVAFLWNDLDPTAGGAIHIEHPWPFECRITFAGVRQYGAGGPNTCQVRLFDNGDIVVKYDNCAMTDGMVGLSPGGGAVDSGGFDYSSLTGATNAFSFVTGVAPFTPGLQLHATLPRLGASWDLAIDGIDPVSPFAVTVFGDRSPAVALTSLGLSAPGCDALLSNEVGYVAKGNSGGSTTVRVLLPSDPTLAGLKISAQSLGLTLLNPANIMTSNALEGTLGY